MTDRAIFFYCLGAALLGAQFTSVGFLAELMTALQARDADTYSIAERAGADADWRSTEQRRRSQSDVSGPSQRPAPGRKTVSATGWKTAAGAVADSLKKRCGVSLFPRNPTERLYALSTILVRNKGRVPAQCQRRLPRHFSNTPINSISSTG